MDGVKQKTAGCHDSSRPAEKSAGKDGRYRIVFGAALACAVLDQITKLAVTAKIPYQHGIELVPGFFDLVHVRNRGAAFGILNRPDIAFLRFRSCSWRSCRQSDRSGTPAGRH